MKQRGNLCCCFVFCVFANIILFILESQAISLDDFYCEVRREIPTTMVRTESGNKPIIYWVSTILPEGIKPEDRCQEASKNLQAAQDNQRLSYLSHGTMNGKQVICVSDRKGGSCVDIIFELKPGSQPQKVLMQLLDLRGIANGKAIEQGNDKRIYINFREYVKRIPPDPK
jgi:hypothetical protein